MMPSRSFIAGCRKIAAEISAIQAVNLAVAINWIVSSTI